jgi:uncharacterized protein (TIGR03084 family)
MTPSPGWSIRDQIGHLAYFDRAAAAAIVDVERFRAMREELVGHLADPEGADAATLAETRAMSSVDLLEHWRVGRRELADAAATLADDTRIEWYGPSMGSKSFLTARLMEAWAHGQDIADTIGAERTPTDRLRHIAQLGFITRGWTYVNRGLEMPQGEVRIELTAPSGARWAWGPDDAVSTVKGSALDFCLVTSQRRNVADTGLTVTGHPARDWLEKAQLFAGPPSDPPPPKD